MSVFKRRLSYLNREKTKKKLTSKFYQSHQACIVNSEAIRDIDFSQNLIKLKNDVVISLLSERHKKVLRQFAKHS